MLIDNLRVTKLRAYLVDILDDINKSFKQLNVDFLSNDVNNYSLDKIPTESVTERWINGVTINRDVFSFRSRNNYSADEISNIENIGFYELFEKIIYQKNKAKELPDIDGIQAIRCLNCGSLVIADTNTAEFDIQLEIEYISENDEEEFSL